MGASPASRPASSRGSSNSGSPVLPLNGAPLLDLALKVHDRAEDLLRTRGAAGNVDVHRHEPIDPLDHRICVEHAARAGTGAHADAPLRLGHLLPDSLEHREHLHRHAPRDDHQVALPRAEPHRLGAEASDVEPARADGHQLDPAAGCGERHRPEAELAAPVHDRVEGRDHGVLRHLQRAGRLQRQGRRPPTGDGNAGLIGSVPTAIRTPLYARRTRTPPPGSG